MVKHISQSFEGSFNVLEIVVGWNHSSYSKTFKNTSISFKVFILCEG
ncbi:MAG: hypothetical protein ACRCVG_04625 [Methanobacteriaceae archaeon]